MSLVSIRAALEQRLAAMSPAMVTADENVPFTPVNDTPFQRVWLIPAIPDNQEFGSSYQEIGIMQVDLNYPLNKGSGTAAARAELTRTQFKRGTSVTSGGVTATVDRTPEIGPGFPVTGRYVLPVRIRFFSNINS